MRTMLRRAFAGAIAVTICASGALVASSGAPAVAAEAPPLTETGIARTVRLTPDTAKTWTVPEGVVDDIEVEIAGAVGAPSDNSGGSGAQFKFRIDPDPGTVLQARFGRGSDSLYGSLAGGGGGGEGNRGWSYQGGRGGDATLLTRVSPSVSCASAQTDLIAVAGGGGGATGQLIYSSWSASRTAGESSTRWEQAGASTVADACRSGAPGGKGLKGERKFHHDAAAGGGGGGGLVAGAGGRADEMESAWWENKILLAATGGRAGSSHLSPTVCGSGCTAPAITGNRGAGYVVLRFSESLSSSISLSTDDGRVLRDRLSGTVSSALVGQVPAGTVSAWLGQRRIADARTGSRGEFSLDVLGRLPGTRVEGLQVRFEPDRSGTRPSSRTISFDAAAPQPALVVSPAVRSDGTREMEVLFSPNAPTSAYTGEVSVEIATRQPGETTWTSRGSMELRHHSSVRSDRACGAVRFTGANGALEVRASFSGTTWLLPVTSSASTFDATAAPSGRAIASCGTPVSMDVSGSGGGGGAPADPTALASRDSAVAVEWVVTSLEAAPSGTHDLAVDVSHDGVAATEGRVDFYVDGLLAATSDDPFSGRWFASLPTPTSGDHSVLAVYSDPADGTLDASHGSGMTEPDTLRVAAAAADLQLSIRNETPQLLPDDPVDLVAEVSTSTAPALVAEVAFFEDDELIGVRPLENGRAVLDDVVLLGPSGRLTARLSGGGDRLMVSESEVVEFALHESPLAVDVTADASRIESGAAGDLAVAVTALDELATSAPTGAVTLWAGDTVLTELPDSEAQVTGRTSAWRVPLASLPAGVRSVHATVSGDPGFADAESREVPLEVVQRATRLTATRTVVDTDSRLRLQAFFDDGTSDAGATSRAADGTARVFAGDRLVGEALVVDGRAEVGVPGADTLRVEFLPLSRELAPSTLAVSGSTVTGSLASTGQEWPTWSMVLAAVLVSGGVLFMSLRPRGAAAGGRRSGAL